MTDTDRRTDLAGDTAFMDAHMKRVSESRIEWIERRDTVMYRRPDGTLCSATTCSWRELPLPWWRRLLAALLPPR